MKNIDKLTIETERLLLVPMSMHYAKDIFKEFTPEITTYMFPKSPEKITETEIFINASIKKMEKGIEYQIVITDKKTKEFLGCGGIMRITTEVPELGIWIKKSAFGKKIGREAVEGLEAWAQKNLSFDYLAYPVDVANIPSRKIAESLGGIVWVDASGQEIVRLKDSMDPKRKLHEVMYKIYMK